MSKKLQLQQEIFWKIVEENAKRVDVHFVKLKTLYVKTSILKKIYFYEKLLALRFNWMVIYFKKPGTSNVLLFFFFAEGTLILTLIWRKTQITCGNFFFRLKKNSCRNRNPILLKKANDLVNVHILSLSDKSIYACVLCPDSNVTLNSKNSKFHMKMWNLILVNLFKLSIDLLKWI